MRFITDHKTFNGIMSEEISKLIIPNNAYWRDQMDAEPNFLYVNIDLTREWVKLEIKSISTKGQNYFNLEIGKRLVKVYESNVL